VNSGNIKKIAASILFLMLFTNFFSFQASSFPPNDFPFHQEIDIDVSADMMYQPVDMNMRFTHPCWAENETAHSIRVIYDGNSGKDEIESQVYNLHHTNNGYVDSCNIVFLLHGEGRYYVYYSDEETSPPQYADHVSVSDESYYYEPIPGYHIKLNYYRVEQDGYCVYGIGQEGSFFGIDMSQKVIKQLDGKNEFKTSNWGQLASFAMFWYGERDEGTDEKLLSKEVIVDGNLMARVRIDSMSSDEKMKTTAFYTYYYCPSKEKRLIADVKHVALEECRVQKMEEDDGLYAYLLTVKCRSSTIPELNLGYIPPYLHINTEDGTIHEYMLNQNPENTDYNWLISPDDDIDLGINPWFSIDDGEAGKAYALIFKNNSVSNYQNGIQVVATEKQEINIPGLEVDGGGINGGRNSYEAGGIHDLVMPKGFTAKFTAEFFSSPDGGLPSVEKEADIFHKLIPYRVSGSGAGGGGGGISGGEETRRYLLAVFPHLAPSVPFSSALSVLTGMKLPVLTVELWRNGTFVSSGVCSRLPLATNADGQISFDWRNFTVMKKTVFPDLKPGEYLVKVFRGASGGRYVGAETIRLDGDKTIHIFCGFEGRVKLNVFDRNGKGISNVDVSLEKDGKVYSDNVTNGEGTTILNAPAPSKYVLKAFYKGFLIYNEDLHLPTLLDRRTEVKINELKVTVTDVLGLSPGVKLSPVLTSSDMEEKMLVYGEEISPGQYVFEGLPSARYTLQIRYKSFLVSSDINLPDERDADVLFPAVYPLDIYPLNSRGMTLKGVDTEIMRDGKSIDRRTVPPGNYAVTLRDGSKIIGEREVFVTEGTELSMVTSKNPSFPVILLSAIFIFIVLFLTIFGRKIPPNQILMIISMATIMLSVIYPWWHMEGENRGMDISTNVFLVPAKMVTLGRADGFINGEVAAMPPLFGTMISMVLVFSGIAIIATIASFLSKRKWIHIIAIPSVISAIAIFSYGMSQIGEVTTGSFWGNGDISLSIPGSSEIMVYCKWSPAIGYYLAVASLLLLIASLVVSIKFLSDEGT